MVLVRVRSVAPARTGLDSDQAALAAEPGSSTVSAKAADPATDPEKAYLVLALVLILVGIGGGTVWFWWNHPGAYTPPAGINNFAIFYIVAQSLERLSELLRLLFPSIGSATGKNESNEDERKSKTDAIKERDKALADAIERPTDAALTKAATKQSTVNRVRANTAVFYLGLNACLASLLCGALGLLILKAVGMSDTPVILDVAISGLAVGGGTKPLHDLITNIQKSKEEKQDPEEVTGT
jgi:hypothetical protein